MGQRVKIYIKSKLNMIANSCHSEACATDNNSKQAEGDAVGAVQMGLPEACGCRCACISSNRVINADLEGIKLDATILESRLLAALSQNEDRCESVIGSLRVKLMQIEGIVKHQDEVIARLSEENEVFKSKLMSIEKLIPNESQSCQNNDTVLVNTISAVHECNSELSSSTNLNTNDHESMNILSDKPVVLINDCDLSTHDVNLDTVRKSEYDESLVTEECLPLRNCLHKSSQQRDESSISITNQLIEEFCPSVRTDVNNTAGELSRLKYDNALLQKNVSALRDENHLLRDTSELLTSELEKRTKKPDGWNSPQIAYSESQINPQLEAISLPLHPQPYINSAEWRDYLNLVHCVTSSQTAQPRKSDDTPKSPQYTNNGGPDMPNRSMHGSVDKPLYPGLSTREHNQRQPIPTRITLRTTSMNRRKRKQKKNCEKTNRVIEISFFDRAPFITKPIG